MPKLSYFSSYSISLDYFNFAGLCILYFILSTHSKFACHRRLHPSENSPNFPEMEFLNGILVEVSGHLHFSVLQNAVHE
jgi:hypothetical protein